MVSVDGLREIGHLVRTAEKSNAPLADFSATIAREKSISHSIVAGLSDAASRNLQILPLPSCLFSDVSVGLTPCV